MNQQPEQPTPDTPGDDGYVQPTDIACPQCGAGLIYAPGPDLYYCDGCGFDEADDSQDEGEQ